MRNYPNRTARFFRAASSFQIQMTTHLKVGLCRMYVAIYVDRNDNYRPPPLCLQGAYNRVINELEQGPTVPPQGTNPDVALDMRT